MSGPPSITVERDLPHRPEKVWRALTEPHLIGEWLASSDFAAIVGHRWRLGFEWGTVECQVRIVEPARRLSYTWNSGELASVVTWTLEATETGTRLRLEQGGFGSDRDRYYRGATSGWRRFLDALEQSLARMPDTVDLPHPAIRDIGATR